MFNSSIETVKKYPDQVVFLGVKLQNPNTEVGHIEIGEKQDQIGQEKIYEVKSFKEKPDSETAKKYFKNSKYLCNTANYFFKAETLLGLIEKHQPETYKTLMDIKELLLDKEKDHQQEIKDLYSTIPKESIANSVFDKLTNKALVIPAKIDWADLGTWKSVYEYMSKNKKKIENQQISLRKKIV